MRTLLLTQVMAVALVPFAAHGADWPQFRGPNGTGVSQETGLPSEWTTENHVHWKVEVPGVGWSCPVVWGGKIFVTTAVTEKQTRPTSGFGGFPGGGRGRGFPGGQRPNGDGENPTPPPAEEGADKGDAEGEENAEGQAGDNPNPTPDGEGDQPRRPRRGFPGGFGRGSAPPDDVYRFEVHCLDAESGQTLWTKVAKEAKPTIAKFPSNSYASETPITDGERLYCYFGMTGLYCFDLDGNPLWSKELGSHPMSMGYGTGASPALLGELLFVQCDNEEKSFLVALDKRSGDEKWRVERDEKSTWSTPFIWKNKQRAELIALGRTIRSYAPETGEVLWELGGMGARCNASPVADEEMLYFGGGGGGFGGGGVPLVAVRAGATGEISRDGEQTETSPVAWSLSRGGPSMASPVLYQGCLYVAEQRGGTLGCYDAKTGEEHYRERLEGARGITSSPWVHDGKLFCLDESGKTFVVKAGPEFELLAENPLDEMCWSTPAIAGGSLLLRTVGHLYCIRP